MCLTMHSLRILQFNMTLASVAFSVFVPEEVNRLALEAQRVYNALLLYQY